MTYGIKSLRQIQLSREASTAQGSPTTDFTVWRGVGSFEDLRDTVFPEEDIGIFGGVDRNYVPKLGGQVNINSTPATFEQLPHIFDAGLYNATPTTDTGTGTGYIRTYILPILQASVKSSTDLQTYSIKGGDNNAVDKASFGFVNDFSLTGTAGEALMNSATMLTREVSNDTDGFVTVTIPTVEEILFSKGKLYIDDVSSTDHADTQVSGTLLAMDLKVKTGWQAVYSADGRLDFGFIKQAQPEIMLDITFEHDGNASAEKAAWRAKTARQLRLLFEGEALTAAGAYTYKTLIVDLNGKWERFGVLDDKDGNDTVTGTFRARYNSTSGTYARFIIVNEVTAMP